MLPEGAGVTDCQGKHLWYSAALAPSRFIKHDWCVNCGTPNPTYSVDDWSEDGEIEPPAPKGEL
jgi:hypothetical protein